MLKKTIINDDIIKNTFIHTLNNSNFNGFDDYNIYPYFYFFLRFIV